MEYKSYYKNHWYWLSIDDKIYKKRFQSLEINLRDLFKSFKKNDIIIEIWCWKWYFTNFCSKKWFSNYTWFELDEDMLKLVKKRFPKYDFRKDDIFSFLKEQENNLDIVYMSHVFEHFSLEEWKELSKLIHKALKTNGIWINLMPNASAPYCSWYLRYNDITHKILYTTNSFNQILNNSGFLRKNIKHKNPIVGETFIKRVILFFWKNIHRVLYISLWLRFPRIYYKEFFSFIKK